MGLISTADLRNWLSVTEGDNGPNKKLDALSKAIESFCDSFTNRKLEASTYTDDQDNSYYDGTGLNYVYVKQYPISYVSSVRIDSDRVFASASLVASADLYWYPSGKIVSEGAYFSRGRRNVKIQYTAGYAPVDALMGTYDSSVSSYPIPLDLKQTMIEMCAESYKEGITAVHTVQASKGASSFTEMLTQNSFWLNVLNKYKAFDASLHGRWE